MLPAAHLPPQDDQADIEVHSEQKHRTNMTVAWTGKTGMTSMPASSGVLVSLLGRPSQGLPADKTLRTTIYFPVAGDS